MSATVEKGEARFCDLGVLHVTVTLGWPYQCNYTVIRDVRLEWQRAQELKAFFDDGACTRDGISPLLPCAVLFRFADEAGNWIEGVRFSPPSKRLPGLQSDVYGRMMLPLGRGEDFHAIATREGFVAREVNLRCSGEVLTTEEKITLKKASK